MGNRAVITTRENFDNNGVGVYLHWNGGRDSVTAFLKYCELRGFRAPDRDSYGWARLVQVIGNFFGGGLSVAIDTVDKLDCDNWDNGVYIIEGWEIADREYHDGDEQDCYDLNEMLKAIDEAQPEKEQLGDYLTAEEVPVSELQVGDTVYIRDWNDDIYTTKVIGFGEDRTVNGTNVKGIPFVNRYGEGITGCANNINNYIRTETVRRA
jgi:hypothetical protein